jgi:hypothetical protein
MRYQGQSINSLTWALVLAQHFASLLAYVFRGASEIRTARVRCHWRNLSYYRVEVRCGKNVGMGSFVRRLAVLSTTSSYCAISTSSPCL